MTDTNTNMKIIESINSEKNKFASMTREQKWDYFKEYYLVKSIVLLVALVLFVWFIKDTFLQKRAANSGCVYGVELSDKEKEALTEGFLEYYNLDKNKYCSYISTDNMFEGTEQKMDANTQEMALLAQITAGEIYYLILDEENLYRLSNGGAFASLDEIFNDGLPEVIKNSTVVLKDNSTKEEYPGAIDLESAGILNDGRKGFLVFTIGIPDKEYPERFLSYIVEKKIFN